MMMMVVATTTRDTIIEIHWQRTSWGKWCVLCAWVCVLVVVVLFTINRLKVELCVVQVNELDFCLCLCVCVRWRERSFHFDDVQHKTNERNENYGNNKRNDIHSKRQKYVDIYDSVVVVKTIRFNSTIAPSHMCSHTIAILSVRSSLLNARINIYLISHRITSYHMASYDRFDSFYSLHTFGVSGFGLRAAQESNRHAQTNPGINFPIFPKQSWTVTHPRSFLLFVRNDFHFHWHLRHSVPLSFTFFHSIKLFFRSENNICPY